MIPLRLPQIVFCLLVLCLSAADAGAQIDRMNYRHWTWLRMRQRQLLVDCLKLDPAQRAAVAARLRDHSERVPPLTIARAIAVARGVKPDASFCFRAGLQLFALPEVIANKRALQVTVWAAFSGLTGKLPMPEEFRFEVRARDAKGKVVTTGSIAASKEFRDLREFRSVVSLKVAALPPGGLPRRGRCDSRRGETSTHRSPFDDDVRSGPRLPAACGPVPGRRVEQGVLRGTERLAAPDPGDPAGRCGGW